MMERMTNASPQIGRPQENLTEAQARRLRALVTADREATDNARRRRRSLARYLCQLRADDASMAAASRVAGMSRQTLYSISDGEGGNET